MALESMDDLQRVEVELLPRDPGAGWAIRLRDRRGGLGLLGKGFGDKRFGVGGGLGGKILGHG